MRPIILLLISLIILPIAAPEEITQFVNDYPGLLSSDEKSQIEDILKEIYDSGKAEYAIVIVDTLDGEDIEGYSYRLAEGNLGKEGLNNGLLLLVAIEDKQYRFEVGRGIEDVLPDVIMARIGRNYLDPNFRTGAYGKGMHEASMSVRDRLFNQTESPYYEEIVEVPKWAILAIIIIVFLVFFSMIFISVRYNLKKGRRKDRDYFTAAWIISQMMKGGKGGFSGGSGGSFGGGSFGGGGFSGRW
jgi:uncharacterized protein